MSAFFDNVEHQLSTATERLADGPGVNGGHASWRRPSGRQLLSLAATLVVVALGAVFVGVQGNDSANEPAMDAAEIASRAYAKLAPPAPDSGAVEHQVEEITMVSQSLKSSGVPRVQRVVIQESWTSADRRRQRVVTRVGVGGRRPQVTGETAITTGNNIYIWHAVLGRLTTRPLGGCLAPLAVNEFREALRTPREGKWHVTRSSDRGQDVLVLRTNRGLRQAVTVSANDYFPREVRHNRGDMITTRRLVLSERLPGTPDNLRALQMRPHGTAEIVPAVGDCETVPPRDGADTSPPSGKRSP